MSRQAPTYLSVDETVAYLKRTSQTTALVEGRDDQKVYRYVEERLADLDLDVLICEGREALLSIHRRRSEFPSAQVVFIADRDMWYFTGLPAEYAGGVLFTQGYSIENDLYVRDVFEVLMSEEEQTRFRALISHAARWQAFHVEMFQATGSCACDVHINQVLNGDALCEDHLRSIAFREPNAALVAEIVESYPRALRGKTLFQILLRILSATRRTSKFSRENLIELGAKLSNPVIEDLCLRTRHALVSAPHAA